MSDFAPEDVDYCSAVAVTHALQKARNHLSCFGRSPHCPRSTHLSLCDGVVISVRKASGFYLWLVWWGSCST
jgi:hypothetical protein